jgi:hypothetical protein
MQKEGENYIEVGSIQGLRKCKISQNSLSVNVLRLGWSTPEPKIHTFCLNVQLTM